MLGSSIAIAGGKSNSDWITNNPKGYKEWFDSKVQNYEKAFLEDRNQKYASIEELPEDQQPTNMIRNVIKVLKRLRDIYYSNSKAETTSPSIIITTIVAKLTDNLVQFDNEFELLEAIVEQLSQVSRYRASGNQYLNAYRGYSISSIITKEDNDWVMLNPTNGGDNILSSWNDNSKSVIEFFGWLSSLENLVSQLIDEKWSLEERKAKFNNSMGIRNVNSSIIAHKVNQDTSSKPWRNDYDY